jgi:hypothetical protein
VLAPSGPLNAASYWNVPQREWSRWGQIWNIGDLEWSCARSHSDKCKDFCSEMRLQHSVPPFPPPLPDFLCDFQVSAVIEIENERSSIWRGHWHLEEHDGRIDYHRGVRVFQAVP